MWWWAKAHSFETVFCVLSPFCWWLKKSACIQLKPVCVSKTSPDRNQSRSFWLHKSEAWTRVILLGPVETLYNRVLFSGVFTFVVICMLLLWSCKCFSAPAKSFFWSRILREVVQLGTCWKGTLTSGFSTEGVDTSILLFAIKFTTWKKVWQAIKVFLETKSSEARSPGPRLVNPPRGTGTKTVPLGENTAYRYSKVYIRIFFNSVVIILVIELHGCSELRPDVFCKLTWFDTRAFGCVTDKFWLAAHGDKCCKVLFFHRKSCFFFFLPKLLNSECVLPPSIAVCQQC